MKILNIVLRIFCFNKIRAPATMRRATFQLFENGSKKIENDIYYGDLDMGITVLPTNNKNFNTFSFLEEKLKLVVHKNHKLSKRKTVNIED